MNELRLALIGCGAHSESAHASSLAHYAAQNPGTVSLAAACDIDLQRARRFCREYGFARAYSDWEAMLEAETPDGVISVLPIDRIAEVASALFRRRIPCVIEKPPGRTLQEVQSLAELARQWNAPHLVSLNRRFSPSLNRAIEWAKQAGPLRTVRGQMFRVARREEDFLWGTGVHIVDALCHIGGELAGFDCRRLEPSSSATPWFLITLTFVSGCVGTIEIVPTTGIQDESFALSGEDYHVVAHTMGDRGESVHGWKKGELELQRTADPGDPLFLRNGSYEETCAFIRSLRESIPLYPDLAAVLPALQVCSGGASGGALLPERRESP